MREIKFRVWDSVMNEMFYNSELSNGDLLVIHIDGRLELSDDDTYKVDDFEIMQYAGLKDDNGKEIYEGDILRDEEGIIRVDFKDGSFNANYITMDGEWKRYGILSDYLREHNGVVIGNIYEKEETK